MQSSAQHEGRAGPALNTRAGQVRHSTPGEPDLEKLVVTAGRHVIIEGGIAHQELPSADEVCGVRRVCLHLTRPHCSLLRVVQEHDAHDACETEQNRCRLLDMMLITPVR